MFDLSLAEVAVVAGVALLAVRPEDIPGLLRAGGRALGKLRGIGREWSAALEGAARESGMKQVVDLEGNLRPAYDPEEARLLAAENKRKHDIPPPVSGLEQ